MRKGQWENYAEIVSISANKNKILLGRGSHRHDDAALMLPTA